MAEWKMYRDDVLKLIKDYSNFECLWNYKNADYKRKDLKRKSWTHLAKTFGKDIDVVKRKIKYLRSAYVAEKKKVDDSKKSGAIGDRIYQPLLYYYDAFSFLDSVIVLRIARNEMDCKVERDSNPIEDTYDGVSDDHVCLEEVFLQPSSQSSSLCSPPSQTSVPSPVPGKRQRTESPPHFVNGTDDTASAQGEIYSVFGKTVALHLTQLPPIEATATMDEIHHLLCKKVMRSMLMRDRGISAQKKKGY